MKKTLFLILICGLFLSACTSKEQDEKIQAFWQGQAMKLMSNPAVMNVAMKMMMRGQKIRQQGTLLQQQNGLSDAEMQKMLEALKTLEDMEGDNLAAFEPIARPIEEPVAVEAAPVKQPKQPTPAPAVNKKNAVLVQALNAVKESNARTLKAYSFLSPVQQQQIKAVMADTEADLQKLVDKNVDPDVFLNTQFNLLDLQSEKITAIVSEDIVEE